MIDIVKPINSYAKQILAENDLSIYAGGHPILEPTKGVYDFDNELPGYKLGETFIEQEDVKVKMITKYEELKGLGFGVFSKEGKNFFSGQHVVYYLDKLSNNPDDLSYFPTKRGSHFVQYDAYNKVLRLVGRNAGTYGFGPWVPITGSLTKREKRVKKYKYYEYRDKAREILNKTRQRWTNISQEPKFMPITDVPIIISDSNEIWCLPQTRDEPVILIAGRRGYGKSFMEHAIIDRMYHHPNWHKNIAIINDSSGELGTWTRPNTTQRGTTEKELAKLNEVPKPLPCVFLHPKLSVDYDKIHPKEVGFDISLNHDQIINNFESFFGASKEFKLEGSAKYFNAIKDVLMEAKDWFEVEAVLDSHISNQQSREKLSSVLKNIYNLKITDKTNNIPSLWTLKGNGIDVERNPFATCLLAGLIPVFETSTLLNYKFFPQYFKYYIEDLFDRQRNDKLFKDSELFLVIDEAHNVSSTELTTCADAILKRCVREGRPRRIGVLITSQEYKKMEHAVRKNAEYVIAFSTTEANVIGADHDMDKHTINQIKTLKKHEVVAYTSNYFTVYDFDGNKRKEQGPVKGKSLHPLSLHKAPKATT